MKRILLPLLMVWPTLVIAQELTPRAYWPAPTGTQVVSIGAAYTSGDIVPDPSLPITGLDSDILSMHLVYARTIDLFGRSSNLIFQLPYSGGETRADTEEFGPVVRDYQGIGDVGVTLSVNLMGAPAMTREDFAELRRNPRPILGASIKVVAPTGRYENDRVVNVGANRWATKLELGYMTVLHPRWLLEFETGVWFFEDNDDFLGVTKEQDPIYSAEMHLVRRFSPGFWASLDINGYRGGRSEVGGRRLDDLQRDSKFGITTVFPFTPGHAIKIGYSHGSVNDADKSFEMFTLAYQHVF